MAAPLVASPDVPAPQEFACSAGDGFHLTIACFDETGEAEKREWILILNGRAYRDLLSLEKGLTNIPKGSTIVWAPSDMKIGGEPLDKKADLDELASMCAAAGLSLKIIPAG
ncbi:hypothetical protein OKA04_14915 [Luteolibacter flavescens]|uniref:Uncharacterized protein n=1 Tax=Luteolibacter flavescens TaxID=1859460 RepID=A0ABT3FRE8_9BACT|nr:hypothetical protein [Luteolibacter flavescens]MCW1886027.1 hypothetical protein [Luteolibacter flavescens]